MCYGKLDAEEKQCEYRIMLKISWRVHIINDKVMPRIQKRLLAINKYQGHIIRWDAPSYNKLYRIHGRRSIGRRRISWLRNLRERYRCTFTKLFRSAVLIVQITLMVRDDTWRRGRIISDIIGNYKMGNFVAPLYTTHFTKTIPVFLCLLCYLWHTISKFPLCVLSIISIKNNLVISNNIVSLNSLYIKWVLFFWNKILIYCLCEILLLTCFRLLLPVIILNVYRVT